MKEQQLIEQRLAKKITVTVLTVDTHGNEYLRVLHVDPNSDFAVLTGLAEGEKEPKFRIRGTLIDHEISFEE